MVLVALEYLNLHKKCFNATSCHPMLITRKILICNDHSHISHETWMCITISMFPIPFQRYILSMAILFSLVYRNVASYGTHLGPHNYVHMLFPVHAFRCLQWLCSSDWLHTQQAASHSGGWHTSHPSALSLSGWGARKWPAIHCHCRHCKCMHSGEILNSMYMYYSTVIVIWLPGSSLQHPMPV